MKEKSLNMRAACRLVTATILLAGVLCFGLLGNIMPTALGATVTKGNYQSFAAVVLENDKIKVVVVPEQGGRIVEYTLKSSGHNQVLFKTFGKYDGCFAWLCYENYSENTPVGDKELSLREHWQEFRDKSFAVNITKVGPAEAEVELSAAAGGMELTYKLGISEGLPLLKYAAIARNKRENKVNVQFNMHFTWQVGGKPEGSDIAVIPLEKTNIRYRGDLCGGGLDHAFEPAQRWAALSDIKNGESILIYGDDNFAKYYLCASGEIQNLEAFSLPQTVAPGASYAFQMTYIILEKMKAVDCVTSNYAVGVSLEDKSDKDQPKHRLITSMAPLSEKSKNEKALVEVVCGDKRKTISADAQHCPLYTGKETVTEIEGPVTEVRIGGRALSGNQIKTLYATWAEPRPPQTAEAKDRMAEITGAVFNDTNGNGKQDAGEQGLAKIRISDGLGFAFTDEQGQFRFKTDLAKAGFVFVITPSGYRNSTRFYIKMPAEPRNLRADFGLAPAPETQAPDFSFLQIADVHVGFPGRDFVGTIKELNGLRPKPAFVFSTGDVTQKTGANQQMRECGLPIYAFSGQMERYAEEIKNFDVPVYSLWGGHASREDFEEFCGPLYYAFDWGGRHFVVLELAALDAGQLEWLKQDLDFQPPDKAIVTFSHFYPMTSSKTAKPILDLLSQYNVIANFSGHWHDTRVSSYGKMLVVNTPPLRFGALQDSFMGFRVISFKDDKLTTRQYITGCKEQLAIVTPQDGERLFKKDAGTVIRASAYDAYSAIERVECRLDDGAWQRLEPTGGWSWQAAAEVKDLALGAHKVQVRVTNNSGKTWERTSAIDLVEGISQRPLPKPKSDWAFFRCDHTGSGATPDTVTPPLSLAWSRHTGGTIYHGGAIVGQDQVYVNVEDNDNAKDGGIVCLDAGTGKLLWKFTTGASVRHSPAFSQGKVFAITITGVLYSLDAGTGKQIWSYRLGHELDCWALASPVVDQGRVYAGAPPRFAALDMATGKELWKNVLLNSESGDICYTLPVVTENRVYVGLSAGWTSGQLFALNRETGTKVWEKSIFGCYTAPTYADGCVYFSNDGKLYAFKAETGEKLWTCEFGGAGSSPARLGSALYLGSTSGKFFAIDNTGKKLWEYQTGKAIASSAPYVNGVSSIASTPALSGNIAYVGADDGKLYAFDVRTGEKVWAFDLGTPLVSSPAISGNTVYIGAYDGTVYAFTARPAGASDK